MRKIPKKWRELPLKTRFEIPVKQFKIDQKLLDKIRRIQDSKKRLIEAARIQYELFGDIHSYLTSWIAGYGSDVVIRQKFGSTRNLLDTFMTFPKIDDRINPSWPDIKRHIKIPEDMTVELAEETGIHIGDGNLCIAENKDGSKSYQYSINGDLVDEYVYHVEHIGKLMKSLYNIHGRFLERANKNNIDSRYKSKAIVQFKNLFLKLPVGSKKKIKIPREILKNDSFMKSCIIGILDTDFSITSSLAISGKINNLLVAKEIHRYFEKNNIKHIFRLYGDYGRFYISKEVAFKIMKEWRLRNQKHISKFRIFEEFGEFVPFTTTPERLAVLSGKLDIQDLRKVSKKRRSLGNKIPSLFSYS